MIIEIGLLLLAIPIGYLLAYWGNDELVAGRKWFRALIIAAVAVGIWFWLTGQTYVTWTSSFIVIVTFIALIKSKDKKWTKRRKS